MKQDVDIAIKFRDILMQNNYNDEYYMGLALDEARLAYKEDEVPFVCIIVKNGQILAKTHNTLHKVNSALNHAEINAIDIACKKLDSWILEGATLYVTLEPCIMCAGAIIQARIKKVVYAATEPKFGAAESVLNIFNHLEYKFNHEVEVVSGILKEESTELIKSFFKELRNKK